MKEITECFYGKYTGLRKDELEEVTTELSYLKNKVKLTRGRAGRGSGPGRGNKDVSRVPNPTQPGNWGER